MKQPLCDALFLYHAGTTAEDDDSLGPFYIVHCVFIPILSMTALIFNSITIQAIRKTPAFSQNLRTLLLSLAISDLGVGLLVQPFYFWLLFKKSQHSSAGNSSVATCTAFVYLASVFSTGSFLGVTTLSIDRFLAVYLHLRYQEFVTNNRVVSVAISNWVLSAIVSTIVAVRIPQRIPYMILGALGIFCLLFIAFLYFKIYLCVRHHQKQIRCLQVQQEAANVANVKKSATGSFYLYLVFSLCYLPQFSSFVIIAVMGFNTAVKTFSISAITFVFLNSSLNPFVYCWKMRHIRHAIMDTLENLCQHNCHIQSRGENV